MAWQCEPSPTRLGAWVRWARSRSTLGVGCVCTQPITAFKPKTLYKPLYNRAWAARSRAWGGRAAGPAPRLRAQAHTVDARARSPRAPRPECIPTVHRHFDSSTPTFSRRSELTSEIYAAGGLIRWATTTSCRCAAKNFLISESEFAPSAILSLVEFLSLIQSSTRDNSCMVTRDRMKIR